jgi:RHS repeat-associated protein
VVGARYGTDANGNRVSRTIPTGSVTAAYDEQDRLLQYADGTYTSTADGQLKSKNDAAGQTTYSYDPEGNLVTVTLPNGTRIDYVMDAEGHRIGKKVNGTLVQGFLYSGSLRPVAELDGAGNVVSRFVYATGDNVPDYQVKGGVTYRIITDNLGSIRLVVNTATGQVVQRMDYDEFGNVTRDTNPGFQPFGFAGGLYDRDTGLVHFNARDYDARTGRWTTKDPLSFAGGAANLYAYASGDPVNQRDPSGLSVKVCRAFPFFSKGSAPAELSHWWIETDTRKQGQGRTGIGWDIGPYIGGASLPLTPAPIGPRIGFETAWVDQSDKYTIYGPGQIQCTHQPNVDEACVNSKITGSTGIYGMATNNCQAVVSQVIRECSTGPTSEMRTGLEALRDYAMITLAPVYPPLLLFALP